MFLWSVIDEEMCVHLPGESHTAQAQADSAQTLSLFARAAGPALIGRGSSHIHTRKCARKHGAGKADQMPCQAWVSHAGDSGGELLGLARTQGRELVSSGKMASVQSVPPSGSSCSRQKSL